MKRLLGLILFLASLFPATVAAQVFTTLYLPTAGSGLTLNIAAGRVFCTGSMATYSAGTLTMTASTTNYVYLNAASSCAPAVKSTAFTIGDIPIATVVAGSSSITSVTDNRTMFNQGGSTMVYPSAGLVKSTGSAWATPTYSDVVALFGSGSCSGYLKSDGTCSTPSSGGISSLNSLTGATLNLISSDSSVNITPSGTDINLQVAGFSTSSGGSLVDGANVVLTGNSMLVDDSGNTLGAQTTATAESCTSGGLCTITDGNSYIAGQWVDMGGAWTCPGASTSLEGLLGYYGMGTRLFQVLATGLSGSQFQIQTPCAAGSASSLSAHVEDASGFMSIKTLKSPAFKNAKGAYLRNSMDHTNVYGGMTGTICDQSVNFALIFGDLLPTVTGKPLYILEDISSSGNDIGGRAESESQIEACYQSVWSQAHTAGAYVVESTLAYVYSIYTSASTFSDISGWLIAQAKSNSNVASGQYWDYSGVDARGVIGSFSNYSASNIAFDVGLWNSALLVPASQFNIASLYTPSIGDAIANSITFPDYSPDVAVNLGLSGVTNTISQKIQAKSSAGTGTVYLGADGYWQAVGPGGQGMELANLLGPTTAPTGSCASTIYGSFILSRDGYITWCHGGTYQTIISGSITMVTLSANNAFTGNNTFTGNNSDLGTHTFSPQGPASTPVIVKGGSGYLTPAIVQTLTCSSGSCAFASNVTAGDAIVVACMSSGSTTASDTLSNTFTNVVSIGGWDNGGVNYAVNISGGTDTITCTNGENFTAYEINNVATSSPLNGTALIADGSSDPYSAQSITLTTPGIVLTGMFKDHSNCCSIGSSAAATGYSNLLSSSSTRLTELVVSLAGTYAPVWTGQGTDGNAHWVMALKAVSSVSQTADLTQYQTTAGVVQSRVTAQGYFRPTPGTFASLTACSSALEGSPAAVTDSTVNTWGSTITGGGSYHVPAYCNGTNWIVQ